MFKKIVTAIVILFIVISGIVLYNVLSNEDEDYTNVEEDNLEEITEPVDEYEYLEETTGYDSVTPVEETIDEPSAEDSIEQEDTLEESENVNAQEEHNEISELEGESYFKNIPMPTFDQKTFNGVDISPMDYVHPHTDVVNQLSSHTINWGDTLLLRGEYVFFIRDILEVGTEVSFEEDVDGKNVITIRVAESQNINFTPNILDKLEQGFEHSEMYSQDVEYEFNFIQ